MRADEVKRGIIVVQKQMTNFAREKALSEINNQVRSAEGLERERPTCSGAVGAAG